MRKGRRGGGCLLRLRRDSSRRGCLAFAGEPDLHATRPNPRDSLYVAVRRRIFFGGILGFALRCRYSHVRPGLPCRCAPAPEKEFKAPSPAANRFRSGGAGWRAPMSERFTSARTRLDWRAVLNNPGTDESPEPFAR